MYLTEQQKQLFYANVKNLNLSVYAKRELDGLYEVNNSLGQDYITFEVFSYKDVLEEIDKVALLISRNPNVKKQYQAIIKDQMFLSEELGDYNEILKKILKLEAALGLELDLKYACLINQIFDETYMDIVNKHYNDPYKVKIKQLPTL